MLFAADTAMAQDCFSVELFVDGSSATQELGNVDLETGFGFEANLTYRFYRYMPVGAGKQERAEPFLMAHNSA